MKQNFDEFHRLVTEAKELAEKLADQIADPIVRAKQHEIAHALIEARRHAIHLESMLSGDHSNSGHFRHAPVA